MKTTFAGIWKKANQMPAMPILIGMFTVLITLKLIFTFGSEIAPDEAYYWVWSQDLALSYYDHPPLNAWLLALTNSLLGTNVFALRFGALLSFAGTLFVMFLFAKRLAPTESNKTFVLSAIVFLASPTLFIWSSIVYNDHLLILLSLTSAYCFSDYFTRFAGTHSTGVGGLYLGAVFLGAAALTKYNAVFLAIAVGLVVLCSSRLRPLLQRPHIYLAGLLVFGMLAPVLFWNLQHDFASIKLHMSTRFDENDALRFHTATLIRFVFSTVLFFGIILVVPLIGLFGHSKQSDDFEAFTVLLFRIFVAISMSTFLVFSARGTVQWYWNDVGFAFLTVLAFRLIYSSWLIWAHFCSGVLLIGMGIFSYTVLPYEYLSGKENPGIARMYGWTELSNEVKALQKKHSAEFVATTGYASAGQLSYAMSSNQIYELTNGVSHFQFANRKELPKGSSAIVLHDQFGSLDDVLGKFDQTKKVGKLTTMRLGKELLTYEFYIGKGFNLPNE